MPDFSTMPEAFVSSADLATAVSREVHAGRLRKLGSRLYTRNLKDPPEKIVQRNLWLDRARLILDRTYAFADPSEADEAGIRLLLPTPEVVADVPQE
jgi:hypothetical protein